MAFSTVGASPPQYPLQSHFASHSSHSQSLLFFHVKYHNANVNNTKRSINKKKKKRGSAVVVPCLDTHLQHHKHNQEEEVDRVDFSSKKRAFLLLGVSVLPLLELSCNAGALEGEDNLKPPEEKQIEEVGIKNFTQPNPFLSILNGIGIFGSGVLGALNALAQKEKKAAGAEIESMTAKLKEKDTSIESLERSYESKILNAQEERAKDLRKAKEEQLVIVSQLNSANGTIAGLGQELNNQNRIIKQLKEQIDGLEMSLSKAGEDKKYLEQELEERLNSIETLQDRVNLLSVELKDKEDNVRELRALLARKELELKNLSFTFEQTQDELARAQTEIKQMKEELFNDQKELKLKTSTIEELNTTVSSLMAERDESNRMLSAIKADFDDLKASSEKKAGTDAKLLHEKEGELYKMEENLDFALKEASRNQAVIAELTRERDGVRKMLEAEANTLKNLKQELKITEEALLKSRNEVSDMAEQLKKRTNRCLELEIEASKIQSEFSGAVKAMEQRIEQEKGNGEELASQLTLVKEQLKETKEELHIVSDALNSMTQNRNDIQNEMRDVYKKAEATMSQLTEERKAVSALTKKLENLEKQILKDKERRKLLETDLEEATKSLDEMNRNSLIISKELEMSNSQISMLQDQKQVLYKSLTEQKKASKEAQDDTEDAHNMMLRLGKERESLDMKVKKLDEELASAKSEILRLRSQLNSLTSEAAAKDQQSSKKVEDEVEDNKVTVNAKRSSRRRRASSR